MANGARRWFRSEGAVVAIGGTFAAGALPAPVAATTRLQPRADLGAAMWLKRAGFNTEESGGIRSGNWLGVYRETFG